MNVVSNIDAIDVARIARTRNSLLLKNTFNFEMIVALAVSEITYAIVDVNNILEVINVTKENWS